MSPAWAGAAADWYGADPAARKARYAPRPRPARQEPPRPRLDRFASPERCPHLGAGGPDGPRRRRGRRASACGCGAGMPSLSQPPRRSGASTHAGARRERRVATGAREMHRSHASHERRPADPTARRDPVRRWPDRRSRETANRSQGSHSTAPAPRGRCEGPSRVIRWSRRRHVLDRLHCGGHCHPVEWQAGAGPRRSGGESPSRRAQGVLGARPSHSMGRAHGACEVRSRREEEGDAGGIVDDEQRRARPQPPCALRVPAAHRHLRRCRSSTMHAGIACVAAPGICRHGARNATHAMTRTGS